MIRLQDIRLFQIPSLHHFWCCVMYPCHKMHGVWNTLSSAGLPRSGKNRESHGIWKLRSRPLKVREFHTFYSKSGKSPWILYHLGSIRIIIVAIPTSVLRICFPVLTARSQCFCVPVMYCPNLTGSHCGLSTLDISFPKSLWYQCNSIAARPTPRLRQPQLWGKESGVYK